METQFPKVPGRVRPYQPGDEGVIQDLYDVCFPGGARSVERWRWRFLDGPEPADLLMLERTDTGEIVGHTALERSRFWIDGREGVVAVGADLMLHPDHRGNRLTIYMWKPLLELYERVDVNLAFPAEVTVHIAGHRIEGVAPTMLGELPQWLWWGTGAAVRRDRPSMPRPVAAAVAATCRLAALLSRVRRPSLEDVSDETALMIVADELDRLDAHMAGVARCTRRRSAEYLRWRWLRDPDRSWSMTVARDTQGTVTGFVVFGLMGEGGRIVDLAAVDAPTQRALVGHALRALQARGGSRVSLELLDQRSWSADSLRRLGMLCRGQGPQIMIMHAAPAVAATVHERGSWYLTIGDSDHV